MVLLAVTIPAHGQTIVQGSGKSIPQAKTRQELDAFGLILDARSPAETIEATSSFRTGFPESEFIEYACTAEMQAAMDLTNYPLAERTAVSVLKLNPKNTEALLTLGEIALVHSAAGLEPEHMSRAEGYVRDALERLAALSAPAFSDPKTWLKTKRAMLARAHMVRGQVFACRKQFQDSENELRQAAQLSPCRKVYVLLAKLYIETNQPERAAAAEKSAKEFGPATAFATAQTAESNSQELARTK
jgi:tetratricopeptide (TPR) repeat protein